MIFDANIEIAFWAEAVNTAVYLINISSTKFHHYQIQPPMKSGQE